MRITIKSTILENRGNSWNFESPKERIYFSKENPTEEEIGAALAEAHEQYEGMGWSKCFVEPPKVVAEAV